MTNSHDRQYLSVGISLAVLAVGFTSLGLLSLINWRQTELVPATVLENSCCLLGSILSILAGATFLFAGCFYWFKTARR